MTADAGALGGTGSFGGFGFTSKVFFDRAGVDAGNATPLAVFFNGIRLILSDATGWAASAVLGGLGCADLANLCFSSGLSAW